MEMRSNSSRQEKMQHVHLFFYGNDSCAVKPHSIFRTIPTFLLTFVCLLL